jgi:muramoyltetrapeptide carboxypeptidase
MGPPAPVMDWLKPPALLPGDTIGIVAPASNIKPDLLEQGCRELESAGFRTHYRPDIVSSFRYFAGSDARRREEFLEMLQAREIKAIFCARGGYGSSRLIPALSSEVLRAHPKIVSGASDITIVLGAMQRARVVSFHGPMVATTIRQGTPSYDRSLLIDLLQGARRLVFPLDGTAILREGEAEGRLTGGCLSLVVSALGTPAEADTTDSIFVLEDIDAKPYQIDRMLTQLKQAGKFDGVRGVVFGEMLNCMQHPAQGYSLEQVLVDVLQECNMPILFGFPTGHTQRKPNIIVPFGVRARLSLNASRPPLFELVEPAVT